MADFPSTTSAYGRWGLMDVRDAIMGGNWPSPPAQDQYFRYVSMLLPGNGTNGAQNNTFLDSSTNNFTVTRNGNTTQGSFSPYGADWSNCFNSATPDYFSVANNTALQFGTGDFTIECWVYLNAFASDVAATLCKRSSAAEDTTWAIDFAAGTGAVRYRILNSTGGVITVSIGTVSLGTWAHIAVSKQSGTTRTYLNGVAGGTTTNSTSIDGGTNNLRIGVGDVGANKYINGYISNARLVKGTAVYTAAFTPSTAPLTAVSGTSLLTCQSNRFIDNSTNNFALTATGTPSVQRFNPFGASSAYSTSVIGGSGYFDGTSDYLSAANNTNIDVGTGAFTIEAWVYRQGGDADWRVMGGSVNGSGFFGGRSGKLGLGRSNVAWDLESSTNVYNDNAWTHIVYVRDGSGNLSIFANGVRVANTTGNSNNYGLNSGSLQVAAEQGGQTWIGYMSNFRLVKGSAVYDPTSTTLTVPTAPLTAVSGTGLLLAYINGAIFDNAMMNDLETVGNAQISTAVSKFGGGSIYLDGSGDWLTSPPVANTAFGNGDFTVEFWINSTQTTRTDPIGINANYNTTGWWGLVANLGSSGQLSWYENTNQRINATSTNWNNGSWNHIAITRSGNSVRMFVNGTQVGSTYTTSFSYGVNGTNIYGVTIGYLFTGEGNALNGYIDDLRITKGYARYTSNFTAPTAAFPTFGNSPVTVPGAPTIGTATGGNAQASVTFTAPANDGGFAITGYRVTSSPGGLTATGASSPIVVTGLTNGTAYTFTAAAQNSIGYGSESAASNSATPSAPVRSFTISPAVSGKSTWDLDVDGPLTLSSYGDWTIVAAASFAATVKIWGAGGGRGDNSGFSTANALGGGAGYAGGTFNATASTFVLRVGQGGKFTLDSSAAASGTAFGGGGSATNYSDANWNCGGGGGLSGIFINSVTQGNSVLIAGGAGGGGNSRNGGSRNGGPGGGSSGVAGGGNGGGGGGGTSSAGGSGAPDANIGSSVAGSALTGGSLTSTSTMGGGGGGGYYGGGSGIYQSDDQVAGGGGGSGYANGTYISGSTLTAGSGSTPGNSGDGSRGSSGNGATTSATAGNDGRIVLS